MNSFSKFGRSAVLGTLLAATLVLPVVAAPESLIAQAAKANAESTPEKIHNYVIFDTYPLMGAYYYSKTESSGNSWVKNLTAKLPVRPEPAFTPGSSIELSYTSRAGGSWKAQVLRHPVRGIDDWDNGVFIQTKPTPYKLPAFLQLWVNSKNTDSAAMPKVSLLSKSDKGEKTSAAVNMGQYLSGTAVDGWKLVKIPMADFKDPSITVVGQVQGLVFEQDGSDEKEHNVFLDQIELRPADELILDAKSKPTLLESKGFERHVDLKWEKIEDPTIQGTIIERSIDGGDFVPVGYRAKYLSRYADFVGPPSGSKYKYRICFLGFDGKKSQYSDVKESSTKALSDDELLSMVQEACSRYYYDGAEVNSGLTLESVPGDPNMIATGASGFGIMSLVVAGDRGFIPREQVATRMQKILSFLEKEDRFHGAMAHYYNGRTGHPVLFFGPDDNGGDLVETSFLMQGLLTARQFFNAENSQEADIRARITKLWENVEFNWYRNPANPDFLVWHWSPDVAYKINHSLIGWNESMITYMLAIASPKFSVPAELYYSGWASPARGAQQYRGDMDGKMYTNGKVYYGQKLDVGGFTGGPIFFIHYNFMGMDPHGLKDKYTEYFENSKAIATINLRYCQTNPAKHRGYGDAGWGLTASDGPWSYNPDEPRPEGDKSKLTPTGALASMPYLPEDAMRALKHYYRDEGHYLWGEYGFRDAFSPDDHWVNDLYMGLNQGPIVVMIENYRTGRPWKLFGSNPEIKTMRDKLFLK